MYITVRIFQKTDPSTNQKNSFKSGNYHFFIKITPEYSAESTQSYFNQFKLRA